MKARFCGLFVCALCALLGALLLVTVESNADLLDDLAKKSGLGKDMMKGILPNLMGQLGEKTKSKVCREQIQAVQKKVAADPDKYMASSQSLIKSMCDVSKFCISEIFKALDKAVPGGPEALTKYIQQKFGVALPMDVDLKTLVGMYYDMTCVGEDKPSSSAKKDDGGSGHDLDEL